MYQMGLAYRIVTNYTCRMTIASVQDTDSLTVHEAVGAAVNQGLFLLHKTRRSLASHLGMTGPAVSRKLQGTTGWTVEDLILTAEFLGVDPASLLPRRVEGAPAAGGDEGSSGAVPGQDSNLRPSAPEADALSTELPGLEA